MVKTNINVTRYIDYGDGYGRWIDIIEFDDEFEAWITCIQDGISDLMFGAPKEQSNGEVMDYDGFVEMVEANLAVGNY
jgi:hypothetical protein